MVPPRVLIGATVVCLLVAALGGWLYLQQRDARCAPVQLLARQLLPNANLTPSTADARMPEGWSRRAPGVELRGPAMGSGDQQGFALDADGRSLQLIGIGNFVQAPAVAVSPGGSYCFVVRALTDTALRQPTRARLVFQWRDASGAPLRDDATLWQPVALWTPEAPPSEWAAIQGGFVAPQGAATLVVRVEPVADDRIYLDVFGLYRGGSALADLAAPAAPVVSGPPSVEPWPLARRAAVAFTFDWETSMGGLVHSRSLADPNFTEDHVARGLRMREGITTTLQIFRPFGVRATYYATGYNFLQGNPERRTFMGDPIFTWATVANGWTSDRWITTPWFADDPYGTVASDPAWYFGDLIRPLQTANQDIQSHTFAHIYGGLAELDTWQRDLETWNSVAAEAGVNPATSIAFPWSGSAGMGDATWNLLEQNGITSVTRLSDQAQYSLWDVDANGLKTSPRCRWLPGREERILACPDFYLTPQRADAALQQVENAVAVGGMIDLWAHTEEVVTPEQIAAWTRVVGQVAQDPRLWVAPLTEIAAWQRAVAEVQISGQANSVADGQPVLTFTVTNPGQRDLPGLTLRMPAGTQRVAVGDQQLEANTQATPVGPGWWPNADVASFSLAAGQSVQITAWLAP